MFRFAVAAATIGVVLITSVVAQSPATGAEGLQMRPVSAAGGKGITNARLIDRSEIRITRVDVEPGGVRVLHTHDDMRYHLIIPISGDLQVNLGTSPPVSLSAWQTHFMVGGTSHGFQNNGHSTVSLMEVMVKK